MRSGMSTPPARALVLMDHTGAAFGWFRIAPRTPEETKWDGLFDTRPASPEQDARSEVRWLHKRHYKRWGEHRVKLDADGTVHISLGAFKLVLEPEDDDDDFLRARPPAPPVTARWDFDA